MRIAFGAFGVSCDQAQAGREFSREQVANLGEFIRQQRQKARLSLRQLGGAGQRF